MSRIGSRALAVCCCLLLSAGACGEEEKANPKQAPSQATADDCKAQLKVYEGCHAQEAAKGGEAAKASKLDSTAVTDKIGAVTDLKSCTDLLGELQKEGYANCWPS